MKNKQLYKIMHISEYLLNFREMYVVYKSQRYLDLNTLPGFLYLCIYMVCLPG